MTLQAWHYESECPDCGKNWGEHRSGYSASKCKIDVPAPPTKLQEAIEEVKALGQVGGWEAMEIYNGIKNPQSALAIATILNAVVKGELK